MSQAAEADPDAPRPMGQLYIEHDKDRLIRTAAVHGWVPVGRDPLTLSKGERQIQIGYNGAGMPNSVQWLGGDEFASMNASGYVELARLANWFAWTPKESRD